MLFNSYDFMLFFPIVIIVLYMLPAKLRVFWLLLACGFFYKSQGTIYFILLLVNIVFTYVISRLTDIAENQRKRILLLVIGLVSNICILIYFKFLNNHISMPLGLSFYTFVSVGYLVDVYRRKIPAESNIANLVLFISFFPSIVSGPIERGKHFLPQINNYKNKKLWDYYSITGGAVIILWGFFLKMVIADRAAIFVDAVYASYRMYGSVELFLASVLYSLQIYCDFASYSLIAFGCAKIMGFELMENFDVPYFSQSIKEFWRRWHISLSTWLRDNVYISLGGGRCSKARKYFNLFVTFLISGIWHGNGLNFIIWGILHGIFQIAGDLTTPLREKINNKTNAKVNSVGYRFGKAFITFMLVNFAWIFFRADNCHQALGIIKRMIFRPDFWVLHDKSLYQIGLNQTEWSILLFAVLILVLIDTVKYHIKLNIDEFLIKQPCWFQWGVILILLYMIFSFGIYGPSFNAGNFIYLNF